MTGSNVVCELRGYKGTEIVRIGYRDLKKKTNYWNKNPEYIPLTTYNRKYAVTPPSGSWAEYDLVIEFTNPSFALGRKVTLAQGIKVRTTPTDNFRNRLYQEESSKKQFGTESINNLAAGIFTEGGVYAFELVP